MMVNPDSLVRLLNLERDLTIPALLRADLRTAWADDRLPVVVLAVMVAAVVLLAGGLGWWLLLGTGR